MIERKLKAYGLKKAIPEEDKVLAETYRAFHRNQLLREKFEKLLEEFEAEEKEKDVRVPKNLRNRIRAILNKHPDLRWDDAIQIVLDKRRLGQVRAEKQNAKRKSGDFTEADEDEEGE